MASNPHNTNITEKDAAKTAQQALFEGKNPFDAFFLLSKKTREPLNEEVVTRLLNHDEEGARALLDSFLETTTQQFTDYEQLGHVTATVLPSAEGQIQSFSNQGLAYSESTFAGLPESNVPPSQQETSNTTVPARQLHDHVEALEQLAKRIDSKEARDALNISPQSNKEKIARYVEAGKTNSLLQELESSGCFVSEERLNNFLQTQTHLSPELKNAIKQEAAFRKFQAETVSDVADYEGAPKIVGDYIDGFLSPQNTQKKLSKNDLDTIRKKAIVQAEVNNLPKEQREIVQEKATKYLSSEWYREQHKGASAATKKQLAAAAGEVGALASPLTIRAHLEQLAETLEQQEQHLGEWVIQSPLYQDVFHQTEQVAGQQTAGSASSVGSDFFSILRSQPYEQNLDIDAALKSGDNLNGLAVKAWSSSQEVVGAIQKTGDITKAVDVLAGGTSAASTLSTGVGVGGATIGAGAATVGFAALPAAATTYVVSQVATFAAQQFGAFVSFMTGAGPSSPSEYSWASPMTVVSIIIVSCLSLLVIPIPGAKQTFGIVTPGSFFYNLFKEETLIQGIGGGFSTSQPQDLINCDDPAKKDTPLCTYTPCDPSDPKSGGCLWPVASATITEGAFISCEAHATHEAGGGLQDSLDFGTSTGQTITSIRSGTVSYVYMGCMSNVWGCGGLIYPGYGNVVVVKGDDGNTLLYAHLLQDLSLLTLQNTPVTVGQPIGKVDNTGDSTGPHLHLQVLGQTVSILSLFPPKAQEFKNCGSALGGACHACVGGSIP